MGCLISAIWRNSKDNLGIISKTRRVLTVFKFDKGRRQQGRGFRYCTSTTMKNPTKESTPPEKDTTTVFQYQKLYITTNPNPHNRNGGIWYGINGREISINKNNVVNILKGSIPKARATLGSKTDNNKYLFKFFQEKIVQHIMNTYTKGRDLSPTIFFLKTGMVTFVTNTTGRQRNDWIYKKVGYKIQASHWQRTTSKIQQRKIIFPCVRKWYQGTAGWIKGFRKNWQ